MLFRETGPCFFFGAKPGFANTKEMRQYFCCSHITTFATSSKVKLHVGNSGIWPGISSPDALSCMVQPQKKWAAIVVNAKTRILNCNQEEVFSPFICTLIIRLKEMKCIEWKLRLCFLMWICLIPASTLLTDGFFLADDYANCSFRACLHEVYSINTLKHRVPQSPQCLGMY